MRISIVTPTLNRAHLLPTALESVRAQRYPEVEHVVVDGLSTDGTAELLRERFPEVRYLRQADSGLYDALNRGVAAATGEIVGHLNSDDCYLPGTFARVAEAFADPAVEVVSGGAEILEAGGKVRHRFTTPAEIALNWENVTTGPLIPNARFYRRSFLARVGEFRPELRVAADREFLFRAVRAQPRAVTVDQVVYRYLWHEESLTFSESPERAERWRAEYLQLAEEWLREAGLPAEAKAWTRRWHLRESAQGATQAVLHGHWALARQYAQRGCGASGAAWLLTAARHLGGALVGR